MKILSVGFVSLISLSLAGCGKGGGAAAAQPVNPYANGQYPYNGQYNSAQPYTCQQGMIQLRNAFGQNQCFQTQNLADACSQVGGLLTQGTLCRKERLISGVARGKFRNNGAMAPDNIPLHVNLFPGESVKVYGNIDSLYEDDSVFWNAQLIQAGAVIGATSGYTNRSGDIANLSITGTALSSTTSYGQQGYNYNNVSGNYTGVNVGVNVGVNSGVNGYYNAGLYNQSSQATPNALILQLMFEGKIRVELKASAISCEDGRGNSYPCQ